MRHKVFGRKLSRDSNERKSLFKGLITSLIIHEHISTSDAKAKAMKGLFEKLVTRAIEGSVSSRRAIGEYIQDKHLINKLVDEIAPRYKNRPGGYTRIVKLGKRMGDNSLQVKLELVEGEKVEKTEIKTVTKTVKEIKEVKEEPKKIEKVSKKKVHKK